MLHEELEASSFKPDRWLRKAPNTLIDRKRFENRFKSRAF